MEKNEKGMRPPPQNPTKVRRDFTAKSKIDVTTNSWLYTILNTFMLNESPNRWVERVVV